MRHFSDRARSDHFPACFSFLFDSQGANRDRTSRQCHFQFQSRGFARMAESGRSPVCITPGTYAESLHRPCVPHHRPTPHQARHRFLFSDVILFQRPRFLLRGARFSRCSTQEALRVVGETVCPCRHSHSAKTRISHRIRCNAPQQHTRPCGSEQVNRDNGPRRACR